MCHKSLPLTFIFSVLAIFTISIITQRDLQADEQAELGRDVIWTQWDAANFTLIDDGPLLWVGTGSGLVKYEKGTGDFSRISKSEGLPLNYVTVGIVDSGGNRWFGGDTGLVKLDSNNKWTHYDSDNSGLLRNHVDKIALAANGDLWLGHGEEEKISHRRADGFWKIYPNVKQTVVQAYADVKQTINPNKLWAVSGEEVWVGYEVYNGDRWEKRTPEEQQF